MVKPETQETPRSRFENTRATKHLGLMTPFNWIPYLSSFCWYISLYNALFSNCNAITTFFAPDDNSGLIQPSIDRGLGEIWELEIHGKGFRDFDYSKSNKKLVRPTIFQGTIWSPCKSQLVFHLIGWEGPANCLDQSRGAIGLNQ